jgi:hypothetical protein
MSRRAWLLTAGVILTLVGVFLPRAWYDAIPHAAELGNPPVKGVTLLQISFVLEGLALLWLSRGRGSKARIGPADRLSAAGAPVGGADDMDDARFSRYALAAVTGLALILRLVNINSDLWLDEIATAQLFSQKPILQVLFSYTGTNNHLLNTLLVKLAVALAGEREWAIRLPAALFGAATIPAFYWVARLALTRRASLAAALLLTVSYHHIFFSQNARGYTPYLLFSLLSSGFLARGLQEDRPRDWALYVVTMMLDFASLLNSGFVLAAHILAGAAALVVIAWRGGSLLPMLKRLFGVFVLVGLLSFQLYAVILPEAYAISRAVYTDPAVGYSPFSLEFLKELARGLSAGLGAGMSVGLILGGLLFSAIAGGGFITVLRRRWPLALSLALPPILTAVYLIVSRASFSPRFFLLGLPLAMLCVAQGLFGFADLIADRLGKSRKRFAPALGTALALLGCAVSMVSLRYYYSVPKQSYRASLDLVNQLRASDGIVIAVHLAEGGYRYYGPRYGLREGENCFYVRSMSAFEKTLADHPGQPNFLVTTFPRFLRITYPDLNARISQGWVRVRTFPATIGDGEVSVWRQRGPEKESER